MFTNLTAAYFYIIFTMWSNYYQPPSTYQLVIVTHLVVFINLSAEIDAYKIIILGSNTSGLTNKQL